MMYRAKVLLGCCFFLSSTLAVPSINTGRADELMSSSAATRLGLEQAWRRQLRVANGAQSIVDFQIYISKSEPREYIEVVGVAEGDNDAPVYFRIATDQIGSNGEAIGKKEAERLAGREVVRMTRRLPQKPTIRSTTVPKVFLYTLSSNGTVDCRDAESGKPVWVSQVGNSDLGYGRLGIDDQLVTVTNGGNIILLDAKDGYEIDQKPTVDVPLHGAIHCGGFVIVPTIRNGMEGYRLDDLAAREPTSRYMQTVEGLAIDTPAKSPTSPTVSWGTDAGFVYFMDVTSTPSVTFRLNTVGIVTGRPATAVGDRFFFGSEGGQAYSVKATRLGHVLWSQPLGEPFYDTPFLMESKVFLNSAYGNLFALDEQTGAPVWETPTASVAEILGGLSGSLFVRLMSGHFATVDLKDGRISHVLPISKSDFVAINRKTDRLYLIDSRGVAQCMRPVGSIAPTILQPHDAEVEEAVEEEKTPTKPETTEPGSGPFNDPFGGGGNDPFGAGGNSGGGDANPFGGGDAGGAETMDDPFGAPAGGGGDPFGENPFG
ncbi:outer membrane protein assembly factor BamB family protein [Roseiconus lacunae]|uniref:outer membrane protein assembly factor BamB family protein n=1 Tax=Roseiconus lacunae TaxID=2605694 RepID=UPI0011F40407|nr:PQQ-binding-like beta-propeller repeat protein [Roseiconus lacunae]MCD0460744.1 PQQ-like beta-propeller repeat protein [Roseiconus lacunae]